MCYPYKIGAQDGILIFNTYRMMIVGDDMLIELHVFGYVPIRVTAYWKPMIIIPKRSKA